MTAEQCHSIADEALSHLSENQGAGGDLVRAFSSSRDTESSSWLDEWFQARIEKRLSESLAESDTISQFDIPPAPDETTPLASPVKIKALQAHYFRGFRKMPHPIDMVEDFIVMEGRNSSGKTSLAEALEWLFTGALSRRASNGSNSRELEQCISNQFRPDDVETWVSATFVLTSDDGAVQEFNLRRVLKEDYGTTAISTCSSTLFFDDEELPIVEEQEVLECLFAGVPPLLMQHTLRDFVQGDPRLRREYFERLLRLDELTELIRQAVVTDERATEFVGPSGGTSLRRWDLLKSMLRNDLSKKMADRAQPIQGSESGEQIYAILMSVARTEFPALLAPVLEDEKVLPALEREQRRFRERSFKLLERLRPRKQLPESGSEPSPSMKVATLSQTIRDAWNNYEPALQQVQAIGESNLAVSAAYKALMDAGLIQADKKSQHCALCAYEEVDTLSSTRLATVRSWDPVREAELHERRALENEMQSLLDVIKTLLQEYAKLLPAAPPAVDWDQALKETSQEIRVAAEKLRAVNSAEPDLALFVSNAKVLVCDGVHCPTSINQCESFIEQCAGIADGLSGLPRVASLYREAFQTVEAAVGSEASADPSYRLREVLIGCLEDVGAISLDLEWEQAKQLAQGDLQQVRTALMVYRQNFLESRRELFNAGIEEVWTALRKESYSRFSKIHIPRPRGRGFPIAIELKASLDDGEKQLEVDALRVFSESQVNVLGIAAFVTRAKLLGHRMLIFDDPVQSMDEEHFKTFARDLIPEILAEGFQVILLTHNDTFARDVSHHHYDRTGYVTMAIKHTRKRGSYVEEGNRRVHERLSLAERKLEEGQLEEAWRYIRLAIERLCLVSYAKYGSSSFKAESWQHQTAESMWNSGADEVIRSRVPNSEGRLKEILNMTVAGAHDTPPRGETDIQDSLAFLRGTLTQLRIGG